MRQVGGEYRNLIDFYGPMKSQWGARERGEGGGGGGDSGRAETTFLGGLISIGDVVVEIFIQRHATNPLVVLREIPYEDPFDLATFLRQQ